MIAILGATGTIGRSLAHALRADPRGLVLFARQPERLAVDAFGDSVDVRSLERFAASEFDLIINAIGAGDPARVAALGGDILDITRAWDERVLNAMAAGTRYVFLSSGVVHDASQRAGVSPYVMAKREAEARHRRLPGCAILDVRVFGYADAALPRDGRFFLSELARSVGSRTPFVTTRADMVRDYAGRTELAQLISCWEAAGAANLALDLYTKAPAHKQDILRLARERFDINIVYREAADSVANAGPVYASEDRSAARIGYEPERTALEVVGAFLEEVAASASPNAGR